MSNDGFMYVCGRRCHGAQRPAPNIAVIARESGRSSIPEAPLDGSIRPRRTGSPAFAGDDDNVGLKTSYADFRFDRSCSASWATVLSPPSVVFPFLALSLSFWATYLRVS